MSAFSRKQRQRIIKDYLTQSRANAFVPRDFLAWLKDRPDHEAYDLFYGIDDETAAQRHREALVRRWVSDLRIVVTVEEPEEVEVAEIKVTEVELPAMFSPVAERRAGGGYRPVDPDDEETMRELRRQAGVDLQRWLERYAGVARMATVDVAACEDIAYMLLHLGRRQTALEDAEGEA